MALDANIVGTNLDTAGNVKVALSNTAANIGGVRLFSENDKGTLNSVGSNAAYLLSPKTSPDRRLRVGVDTLLFDDTFNAPAQNTHIWSYTFVIMTASQLTGNTLNFGVVQGTANTHGAFMRTFQYFPLVSNAPLYVDFKFGQYTASLVSNENFLAGLGLPSAAGNIPTDGVWFQLSAAGLYGVLAFNGTLNQTGLLLPFNSIQISNIDRYAMVISEQKVEFWFNDQLLGNISLGVGYGQPFMESTLPIFMQKYCTGSVTNTNIIRVSDVSAYILDVTSNKPWAHQMAGMGRAYVGMNGSTQGKLSLWTNNTAPTAAAITNTTAAAVIGLGGIAAVLPSLTANNDGILMSYQNPAGSLAATGRNLYITGVKIQGAVSVILAGGPVIYAYAVAFGHTAVSLATTEAASFAISTTHSPRIVPIGIESYAATAAVGTLGAGVTLQLQSPIVVRPGEFVQIIARNIGTVTTTGAITFTVTFDHYFE